MICTSLACLPLGRLLLSSDDRMTSRPGCCRALSLLLVMTALLPGRPGQGVVRREQGAFRTDPGMNQGGRTL